MTAVPTVHNWFAIAWQRFQCIRCGITHDDGRPCAGSYQARIERDHNDNVKLIKA